MAQTRARDIGIYFGRLPTGPANAITDVPDVLVGHSTLLRDEPSIARTGITVVSPRNGGIWQNNAFAAMHALNGFGEMTGATWIHESGLLCSPIVVTSTTAVGMCHRALQKFALDNGLPFTACFPVVLETADLWLNPPDMSPLTSMDLYKALSSASSGPVAEGNVGGGTGMTCHEFKGGIGTASRVLETCGKSYTLGALVQSNHGRRDLLRIDGVRVGAEITAKIVPSASGATPIKGSIVVVLATDAPLLAEQLKRVVQRATIGISRTGGLGENWSGDIFVAFATGNAIPTYATSTLPLEMVPHTELDMFFEAAADAVEEAIVNSLFAGTTMTGFEGRTAHALPIDLVKESLRRHQVLL